MPGYLKDDVDVKNAMQRLWFYIDDIPARYKDFFAHELLQRPSPVKWSRQEILGHLVDSAVNNLKRFTEVQVMPQPYIVVGYPQEELVKLNNYQELPLEHLLLLWQSLNRQIVHTVRNISEDKLNYAVDPQYEDNEMKTLGWLICDYVAHMEHHFRQIFR